MAKKIAAKRSAKRVPATKKTVPKRTTAKPTSTVRTNTKQAQLIDLLRRPEGATIRQVCAALDWKPHSVRGALAGTLKKRLGLNVHSEKPNGGDRVYRIAG